MAKFPTPELTEILEFAVSQHQPPLVKGRRIKLRYAHSGGHNPPRIVIHGNQVESLPKAYRTFLANFFREKLNLVGTPIHLDAKPKKPFGDEFANPRLVLADACREHQGVESLQRRCKPTDFTGDP